MISIQSRILSATAALCAAATLALPVSAERLPAELPPVDLNAPVAKDKPVKVYIMSGQSNMLGFGRIEDAPPLFDDFYLSADPSATDGILPIKGKAMMRMGIYQGQGEDAATGGLVSASKQAVELGATSATVPAGTVEAYLEVPVGGQFDVQVGLDASSAAVAKVNGQEVYRKEKGSEAVVTPIHLKKNKRHKISITYEEGGSAALWLKKVDLEGMGDLRWVVNKLGKFKSVLDEDGKWVARHDVIHTDAYMGKGKSAPLSAPACGGSIGPELGFGWVMGEFHDAPVIVMKADIGNRSLGWDILPPGSESFTHEGKNYPGYGERLDDDGKPVKAKKGEWYAGKQYDEYTAAVHKVLDNFGEKFPEYKDQGYEIAGFVWWQGHKDGPNPGHNARYEHNMVNLIKAWRKEFNAPEADWTIATVGFEGADMPEHYRKIAQAQMNVADPERYPELAGDVKTIDARPFWRPAGMSPKNQGYHYHHNAETYMLVGDALGRAMVELKGGEVEYPSGEMDSSIEMIPYLGWLNVGKFKSMEAAMKPIMLNDIIPHYIATADGLPKHLRGGILLSKMLANQKDEDADGEVDYQLRSQLDRLISYYEMAGIDTYNWQAADPEQLEAEWHYYSFDPKEPAPKKGSLINYREITLPSGMENWFASDFNPETHGWKIGQAPFGQKDGKVKALRGNCNAAHCKCDMVPNTLWPKEVLLMRTKLEMPEFDPQQRYRLIVGGEGHKFSGEGYALYLNGELVSEKKSGGYKNGGKPRGIYLFEDFQKQYSGQKVDIALISFLRTSHHKNRPAAPEGHLNAWVQTTKLPPVLLKRAASAKSE